MNSDNSYRLTIQIRNPSYYSRIIPEISVSMHLHEFIKNITEEGDNVMRILFICGNGVSSGMIASRTGKAGKAQGYDVDTEAYSYTELSEVIDDFDVVLAAPQMKCNEEMIRETCEEHGKKYAIIDNYAFATLDGTKCFELAKNLI